MTTGGIVKKSKAAKRRERRLKNAVKYLNSNQEQRAQETVDDSLTQVPPMEEIIQENENEKIQREIFVPLPPSTPSETVVVEWNQENITEPMRKYW